MELVFILQIVRNNYTIRLCPYLSTQLFIREGNACPTLVPLRMCGGVCYFDGGGDTTGIEGESVCECVCVKERDFINHPLLIFFLRNMALWESSIMYSFENDIR